MQNIEYKQNGFFIDNKFIAYQSIVSINEPDISFKEYPISLFSYVPYEDKYCVFYAYSKIELSNRTCVYLESTKIKINIYENTKFSLKNLFSKKISLRQFILNIPNKNPEYLKLINDTSYIEKAREEIFKKYDELISEFNKWRIYYFN